jgi:hypothetical protein
MKQKMNKKNNNNNAMFVKAHQAVVVDLFSYRKNEEHEVVSFRFYSMLEE